LSGDPSKQLVRLTQAQLDEAVRLHALFRESRGGHRAVLVGHDLSGLSMVGGDMSHADFTGSSFFGDDLRGSRFDCATLFACDFRQANLEASQTIDIVSFVERAGIPPEYFEMPYFLEPTEGGEKTYALLREAMRGSSRVAIGSFVIRGRQHFCAIFAHDRALMLNTLRFAEELVPAAGLQLPPAGASAVKVSQAEIAMARRLVEEMGAEWRPEAFKDTYRRDLMRRIQQKIRKRQTHALTPPAEPAEERPSAEVIDLMAVLRKSLAAGGRSRSSRKAA